MTKYGWRDGELVSKKVTVQDKIPVQYLIPKTVAYSTAAILSGEDLASNGTAAYANAGILVQPPYPMQLNVTANSAGTAGNTDALTFVGKDAMGKTISESILVSSTATTTNTSSKAFAVITSITPNAVSASADVGVGYNNEVVGLPYPIASSGDIISYAYDGGYSTAAASGLTISAAYDTLTLTGTAASKVVSVVYKSKLQE